MLRLSNRIEFLKEMSDFTIFGGVGWISRNGYWPTRELACKGSYHFWDYHWICWVPVHAAKALMQQVRINHIAVGVPHSQSWWPDTGKRNLTTSSTTPASPHPEHWRMDAWILLWESLGPQICMTGEKSQMDRKMPTVSLLFSKCLHKCIWLAIPISIQKQSWKEIQEM